LQFIIYNSISLRKECDFGDLDYKSHHFLKIFYDNFVYFAKGVYFAIQIPTLLFTTIIITEIEG